MRYGLVIGRVTSTRETIYLDPWALPVDVARGSDAPKTVVPSFVYPTVTCGLAVVGMDRCGHANMRLALVGGVSIFYYDTKGVSAGSAGRMLGSDARVSRKQLAGHVGPTRE